MDPSSLKGKTGKRPSTRAFTLALLASGLLILGAYAFGIAMLARYGSVKRSIGWWSDLQDGGYQVMTVDPAGTAAGLLLEGDRLLAVNGDRRAQRVGPGFLLQGLGPGRPYSVRVQRSAVSVDVPLTMGGAGRTPAEVAYLYTMVLVGLAFLATSLVIGLQKPDEALTRLGSVALLLPALSIFTTAVGPVRGLLTGRELFLLLLIPGTSPVHLVAGHAFYSRFPEGTRRGRFLTIVEPALFVLATVLLLAKELAFRVLYQHGVFAHLGLENRLEPFRVAGRVENALTILLFAAICVAVARNTRAATDPDQRRRMRWIAVGSLAGLSPWLFYLIVANICEAVGVTGPAATNALDAMVRVANLALMIVPITTGYAVVKHRLFDIHVVVRRGLRYLLARRVLSAILAMPVIALCLSIYEKRDRSLEDLLLHNSASFYVILAALGGLLFRTRLREWLDRMFFRGAYDRERILIRLSEDVPKLDSFAEISRLVGSELEAALHPSVVYIFQREQEDSVPVLAFSSGDLSRTTRIPEDSVLVRLMEGEDRPRDYPLKDGQRLPESEERWLSDLGVTLIVPMAGARRLVGLLLLGEKRSEEPYGPKDRALLQAIAGQMAIVHENTSLKERVESDRRIKREVLSRLGENQGFVEECPKCGRCFEGSDERCPDDGAELALSLPVGRTLEGRYRLERLIGKGGMGGVYEASDQRLDRTVAVKVLVGSHFSDHASVRRFEREARASAKLNHPNVIAVYDYGTLGGSVAFLVMERVKGVTLRQELRANGTLHPHIAAGWFDQILEGVKAAHASGIIHRDLKPENILIAKDGDRATLKILDFGLAKVTMLDFRDSDSLTIPGTVLGTLGYMSPEQVSGSEVDARTDVFSLGILVVESLTGRLPFRGGTLREMMASTLNDPFELPPHGPEWLALDAVLRRCLAKEPKDRFDSIGKLQAELIPAMRRCPPFRATVATPEARTRKMS